MNCARIWCKIVLTTKGKTVALLKVRAIEDTPDLVKGIVAHSTKNENKVCSVCKLGVWSHGPESQWLGYAKHDFSPMSATQEMLDEANRRTGQAYRNRCALEMCGAYCVSTHKK